MRLVILKLILSVIVFAISDADVSAQRTTRSRLKPAAATEAAKKQTIIYDTVAVAADTAAFSFSGYEKTLRSNKETFFATNLTDSVIDRLTVKITYKDSRGRTLDTRLSDIDIDIAPSQTRRIDISSWDTQKVFYYHLSPVPRTANATPYLVKIELIAAMRRR